MLNPKLTEMAVQVFAQRTERDKQVKIGASNMSNPCNKCLAEDMLGIQRDPSWAWMGAVIGTAIHGMAEERLTNDEELRELFHQPHTERKLVLGTVKGYGEVRSTTDLYVPDLSICWDWKTTTREKLAKIDKVIAQDLDIDPELYSTRVYEDLMGYVFTVKKYLNQLHAYAMGCEKAGLPVKSLAIAFVCRDARSQEDIKVYEFGYDPDHAKKVWERVEILWEMLQDGYTPNNFDGHQYCWYCQNKR